MKQFENVQAKSGENVFGLEQKKQTRNEPWREKRSIFAFLFDSMMMMMLYLSTVVFLIVGKKTTESCTMEENTILLVKIFV